MCSWYQTFGVALCTAPLQLATGGHMGTQSTLGSIPACLGVQLEGLGTQIENFPAHKHA